MCYVHMLYLTMHLVYIGVTSVYLIYIWKDHASVYILAPVTDCALFSSPAALYTKSIPLGINCRACDREKDPGVWENTGNDGGIQQDGNAGMF